ncbi:CAP domain-containing protein [Oceanomicrobium pacificus]|uniref:SCP domain-containing protein n=1 Tax=Oceanomicrobium pacificus TaxID=2692916 RepID=A0A6B0TSC1_9RHOB|nr:CAP domain-containing protein [Oceanomicrobium pacificus]MXU64628.1 hypothetical protein [Oceanomicrobium pacificus]
MLTRRETLTGVLSLPALSLFASEAEAARAVAQEMFLYSNQWRRKNGLSNLAQSRALTRSAQDFAEYMHRTNRFGHSVDGKRPMLRARAAGYRAMYIAENIAGRTYRGAPEPNVGQLLVGQWINSPGHRKNMASRKARDLGCGVMIADGMIYAVQTFGRT